MAALASATIDVVAFRELFSSPILSILAMMGLAVALNLCSETDAFIAAGFRAVFPRRPNWPFMVLGPMLDLKLVLQYFTLFRSRMIGALALLTVVAVPHSNDGPAIRIWRGARCKVSANGSSGR